MRKIAVQEKGQKEEAQATRPQKTKEESQARTMRKKVFVARKKMHQADV